MSLVLLSQRVGHETRYSERRDMLDQRWALFLQQCGLMPLPIMNAGSLHFDVLQQLPIAGLILSGGNDLVDYGGDAPERDQREMELLRWAIDHQLPVLGICRGMQLMVSFTGGKLLPVVGHVGVTHRIPWHDKERAINSYHQWACQLPAQGWRTLSSSKDGVIKAIQHQEHPWIGIMWHPERQALFDQDDIELFIEHLQKKGAV